MGKLVAFLYGIVAYLVFAIVIVYSLGFVSGLVVPKTIDSGSAGPLVESIVINLVLLTIFAVQHSVMARRLQALVDAIIPESLERSTYVLPPAPCLRSCCGVAVAAPSFGGQGATILRRSCASVFGWLLVLVSTFLINHFELFGLQQVFAWLTGREMPMVKFRTPMLYSADPPSAPARLRHQRFGRYRL